MRTCSLRLSADELERMLACIFEVIEDGLVIETSLSPLRIETAQFVVDDLQFHQSAHRGLAGIVTPPD